MPDAAVKRSRFRCALESDESADTVIWRPRLATVMLRSLIVRIETTCTLSDDDAGAAPRSSGAGSGKASGMSTRLSATETSASSTRCDHNGFSPVDS
ncbi:MAG: hypothetical protein DMF88_12230 [Acidobacteria bacterium]|nr:MAG: hypothetical protein DMF88_12230 [Acidobacteriota bacterium]